MQDKKFGFISFIFSSYFVGGVRFVPPPNSLLSPSTTPPTLSTTILSFFQPLPPSPSPPSSPDSSPPSSPSFHFSRKEERQDPDYFPPGTKEKGPPKKRKRYHIHRKQKTPFPSPLSSPLPPSFLLPQLQPPPSSLNPPPPRPPPPPLPTPTPLSQSSNFPTQLSLNCFTSSHSPLPPHKKPKKGNKTRSHPMIPPNPI